MIKNTKEGMGLELLEWIDSDKKHNKIKLSEIKHFDLYFVGLICLATLIFSIIYVLLSRTVYFWDDATYWEIGRMLKEQPFGIGLIKDVYNSIGTMDYNYFLALPVALWMKIFGITRVSYISSVIIFYVIPTEILLYFIAKRISKAPKFAYILVLAMIPAWIYIAVIGFIDVFGVFLGLLCYYLYFTDILKSRQSVKSIIIGILLVLIMISRRYFAFFSVSFITMMAIDAILIKKNIRQLIITAITTVAVLLIFFYPFFVNILIKDYGTMYSSYKYSFYTDLKLITRYFGTVFLIFIIGTVPYTVVKQKEIRSALALLQMLVCAVMFISTQTHGQQHLLLYMPALMFMVIFAVNSVTKHSTLIVICIVALCNIISPMLNRVQPQNIQEIKFLSAFPSYSVKPEKRDDINEILAIRRGLDSKITEGEKCGVLASSFVLNSSILINIMPSLNMNDTRTDGYIVGLPEVDSRDYWRLDEIYGCDYILLASPAQTHLASGEQTIVTEGVNSFVNSTDFAQAFTVMTEFKYKIGDVNVMLYKRVRDVTNTEKTEFNLKLYK